MLYQFLFTLQLYVRAGLPLDEAARLGARSARRVSMRSDIVAGLIILFVILAVCLLPGVLR